MKITTPAALLGAGFLLCGALAAQDPPAEKKAEPVPPSEKTPTPAPVPTTPPKATPPKPAPPEVPPKPKMDPAQIRTYTSYGFGYRNGRNFTQQTGRYGLNMEDVDREQFLKGLFDALELKDSAIEQDKINDALNQLSELIKDREKQVAENNKAEGATFLAENKKREGVITTDSGLQYEILKEGKGEIYTPPAAGARPNKQFYTIYKGTLLDGTEFDSSKGEATPMSLNVIPGFKEILTTMPVGSKWKVYIPSELAYKEARRSALLGPNSTLIFELELTAIKDLPAPPSRGKFPGRPGQAVSPPVRAPGRPGAKAVSPAVRVPTPPRGKPGQPRARAVSPPVRIPTNPQPKAPTPKPAPKPGATSVPKPAPKPAQP
ncbi:MAG: FKBP-type peptidyl-prolyl cis-trans isomerase N-terminal domain-containing protein [Roseibacillus sp.]